MLKSSLHIISRVSTIIIIVVVIIIPYLQFREEGGKVYNTCNQDTKRPASHEAGFFFYLPNPS